MKQNKVQTAAVKVNTAKTIKAIATAVKSAFEFQDAKQLYRVFKRVDLNEYDRQSKSAGQYTICALRSGRFAESRDSGKGTDIMVCDASQGVVTIQGKRLTGADSGADAIHAGRFILSSKGLKNVRWFKSNAELSTWVKSHGEKAESFNAKFAGMMALVGAKYSLLRASDGSLWRWEQDTCKRGAGYYASTF